MSCTSLGLFLSLADWWVSQDGNMINDNYKIPSKPVIELDWSLRLYSIYVHEEQDDLAQVVHSNNLCVPNQHGELIDDNWSL